MRIGRKLSELINFAFFSNQSFDDCSALRERNVKVDTYLESPYSYLYYAHFGPIKWDLHHIKNLDFPLKNYLRTPKIQNRRLNCQYGH
jgi:hypothetical protein